MPDSNTVYQARLHWIIFAAPVLVGLGALLIGIFWPVFKEPSTIFFLISVVWLGMTWVNYCASSLTIEKKRVVFCTGVLVRKTTDIPYAKIESVDLRMSIPGSVLKYGTLMITGTGGTRHIISFIRHPLTCRRYIEQFLSA